MADALVAPEFKDAGLLDTAVVVIRFDNGARAVAEASFSAAYGYDVRGEVFGSAGMVTAGDGSAQSPAHCTPRRAAAPTRSAATSSCSSTRTPASSSSSPPRSAKAHALRHRRRTPARALAVALACIESVETGAPGRRRRPQATGSAPIGVHPGRLRRDGVHRPAVRRAGRADRRRSASQVEIWDWTAQGHRRARCATGATFSSMTGYIEGNLTDPDGADGCSPPPSSPSPVAAPARHPAAQPARHRARRPGPAGAARSRWSPARCGWPPRHDPDADRRPRRARGRHVRAGEPQHGGRPPRHAVRQGGGHASRWSRPSTART